jgi:hypothetical protein
MKKKLFNSICKVVRIKVVSKDVGAWENGAKTNAAQKYFFHLQRLNCEENNYELEDHVG